MPKLSIQLEGSKTTHELTDDRITSARPADFTSASPFPNRTNKKDWLTITALAAAAIAIGAFLLSLLSLLQIHAPAL